MGSASITNFMAGQAAQNWITLGATLVAFFSFVLALLTYRNQRMHDRRIELQEHYLRLELESNAVFRFEAEHGDVLAVYKESVRPPNYTPNITNDSIADQFYLQQLNLFEIAARFRRGEVFDKHIFGSWVIWFHDVARSWWFREHWTSNYADNYTGELYGIFTPTVAFFDREIERFGAVTADDQDARAAAMKEAFFQHVAALFNCPVVLDWLDRHPNYAMRRLTSPSTKH